MKRLCIFLVYLYQICLSPFFGQCCRFVPSCSDYAKEAFEQYGVMKGGWLTVKRLIKCGPWHRGGVDLVPEDDTTSSLEESE